MAGHYSNRTGIHVDVDLNNYGGRGVASDNYNAAMRISDADHVNYYGERGVATDIWQSLSDGRVDAFGVPQTGLRDMKPFTALFGLASAGLAACIIYIVKQRKKDVAQ